MQLNSRRMDKMENEKQPEKLSDVQSHAESWEWNGDDLIENHSGDVMEARAEHDREWVLWNQGPFYAYLRTYCNQVTEDRVVDIDVMLNYFWENHFDVDASLEALVVFVDDETDHTDEYHRKMAEQAYIHLQDM